MSLLVPIPTKTEDVTAEWLSKILRKKISSENFQITPNAHAGSGFLSNLIRLSCETEGVGDEKSVLQLIVKLLPAEGAMKDLVVAEKMDKCEIDFYRFAVPDLVEELPELEKFFCPFYEGAIQEANAELNHEYASVLILEDLKPLNYYTINFTKEENLEQVQATVEFMAKFHFAGDAVVEKKQTTYAQLYPFLQFLNNEGVFSFFEMGIAGFKDYLDLLAEKGAKPETQRAYQELAPYYKQVVQIVRSKSLEFGCMIHGDLWSNNLLFNDDPKHTTKVIDWQLAGYYDPTFDLGVLLVATLPVDKLTPEYVDKYLNIYFDVYSSYATKAGLPNIVRRDRKSFSRFFYTYGMAYTFLWFTVSTEFTASNFDRLVKILEFLHADMHVPQFVMDEISKISS